LEKNITLILLHQRACAALVMFRT